MSELRDAVLAILNYPGEASRLRYAVGSLLYNRLVAALEADQPAATGERFTFDGPLGPGEGKTVIVHETAARGTTAPWLREGLAQVAREATPEQLQRVADHPSGFLPERGTPADELSELENICSPEEQRARIDWAKREREAMQRGTPAPQRIKRDH